MKNLTAQKALKSLVLKKVDPFQLVTAPADQHDFHLLYIDLKTPLDQRINLILKRSIDLLFSSLFIVCVLSWLIPVTALLIKIESKGPVFFLQKRNSKNGKLFTCIKFRTMVVNDMADILPAVQNDFRITRLGKFLRHHHLDELPQVFNVWCGDMSLIGPRPYMVSDNKKYEALIREYTSRYKVKPGITGLAQILTYASVDEKTERMEERVQQDLYYIRNWSPLLDAKIIFRTLLKMSGIN